MSRFISKFCYMEYLLLSKSSSFLFSSSIIKAEYGFFALRMILGYLLLDTVIPRWYMLAVGHPEANGVVTNLFGASSAVGMTYFVTGLETIAAIFLLLGFMTRLAALWGIIEFAITGAYGLTLPPGQNCTVLALPTICTHITGSFGLLKDFGLMGLSIALFLGGNHILSIDKIIVKRKNQNSGIATE